MTTFGLLKATFFGFAAAGSLLVVLVAVLRRRLGHISVAVMGVILTGFVVLVDSHYIEPNWIKVERVKIKDPALARVVGNTRIIQLTDIHLNNGIGSLERKLIKKVNKLKPDIIFFTGDIIDDLSQVDPAIELFNSFEAKIGIFGVAGNTDHIVMDSKSLAREFEFANINFLINETRKLRLPNGNFLWIIGVDDPKYNHAKIEKALEGIPYQVPKIMIAHAPSIFHDAIKNNINLLLVGDTHGGQVGIDFLIRMSDYANRTPYMRGLFQEKETKMYVNRGIGTKTLPIRFLCRPEIALIEVEP